MKEKIFSYLKTFKIDLEEILKSRETNGEIEIVTPKYTPLKYTVSSSEQETDILFYSESNIDSFNHLYNGLKKLIDENPDTNIQLSTISNDEWLGFNDDKSGIQVGVKNEPLRFEARVTLKK